LGREFSLLKVSNPRIRLLALKKAEQGDELIVRLVELDGKPQSDVRISFDTPISAAREVNGQELPVGTAAVNGGSLVTSFSAYQPRTFAVRLAALQAKVAAVHSMPVTLHYDLATASNDGTHSDGGFDRDGNALPAEMLPERIAFNDVQFQLAPAKTDSHNAVVAKGQMIDLPSGQYNRIYVLAASAEGDQKATFAIGSKKVELNIQDWGGFIGQWYDRQWSSSDTSSDNYGKMIGLAPAYIKRADLAWYCSHHHNAAGENVPYGYSYLFAYAVDLPEGAKTIQLPDNDKIRVLAMSVAEENPEVRPAQPLYDTLALPPAGADDFALQAPASGFSVLKGRSTSTTIAVTPRGNFRAGVNLSVSGLPPGVTASFSPAGSGSANNITLTAKDSSNPGSSTITITGTSGGLSHTVTANLAVTAMRTGTVAVDLSSAYNAKAIYTDGTAFAAEASADGEGFAYSKEALGSTPLWDGILFNLGPANAPDVVTSKTVALPAGKFAALRVLAAGVEGSQEAQVFTITYADGTSASITQSLSDWYQPSVYEGESEAVVAPYRLEEDGSKDNRTFYLYGYSFKLDSSKSVRSIALPGNEHALVFAMTLVPPAGS
jgi:alpha-mannosidase